MKNLLKNKEYFNLLSQKYAEACKTVKSMNSEIVKSNKLLLEKHPHLVKKSTYKNNKNAMSLNEFMEVAEEFIREDIIKEIIESGVPEKLEKLLIENLKHTSVSDAIISSETESNKVEKDITEISSDNDSREIEELKEVEVHAIPKSLNDSHVDNINVVEEENSKTDDYKVINKEFYSDKDSENQNKLLSLEENIKSKKKKATRKRKKQNIINGTVLIEDENGQVISTTASQIGFWA